MYFAGSASTVGKLDGFFAAKHAAQDDKTLVIGKPNIIPAWRLQLLRCKFRKR
jgi:hypothetical protein